MTSVPAEVEVAPPGAAELFGADWPLTQRYAAVLVGAGRERGLLGPREAARIWTRHVLQGAVLGELIDPGTCVLDVGSGAGLPGLALALARPDLSLVLLDASVRRTRFLTEVVAELGLGARVEVLRARVEELPRRVRYPVVTSRATAPLATLRSWVWPRLAPGGQLLAMVGASDRAETVATMVLRTCGVGLLAEPVTVAVLKRT